MDGCFLISYYSFSPKKVDLRLLWAERKFCHSWLLRKSIFLLYCKHFIYEIYLLLFCKSALMLMLSKLFLSHTFLKFYVHSLLLFLSFFLVQSKKKLVYSSRVFHVSWRYFCERHWAKRREQRLYTVNVMNWPYFLVYWEWCLGFLPVSMNKNTNSWCKINFMTLYTVWHLISSLVDIQYSKAYVLHARIEFCLKLETSGGNSQDNFMNLVH